MVCSLACECNVDEMDWPVDYRADMYTDASGAETLVDCDGIEEEDAAMFKPMAAFENHLNCAGFCEKSPFFTFTEFAKGYP